MVSERKKGLFTNRRVGLKEEEAIARQVGGRVEVGSGAFFRTLDVSAVIGGDQFLIEVKSTKREVFVLNRSLWLRICDRAAMRYRKPMLVVVFRLNSLRKMPLAVIPASVLPEVEEPLREVDVKGKTIRLRVSDGEPVTRLRWFFESDGECEEILVMPLSHLVRLLRR